MKILFVVPYPLGRSPSQRFRFEQYFSILEGAGHQYRVASFLTEAGWNTLYTKGNTFAKIFSVVSGMLRRFALMFSVSRYDLVFIHREAAPAGPPVFEWIIAKIFGKKLVYDFDDAIWLTDKNENALQRFVRWRSKVKTIAGWAYRVSCGNKYLCDFAKQYNQNVVLNPTTIDTSYHTPIKKGTNNITIGWTGSHSTLKYLGDIVPAIGELEKKYPQLVFIVIANQKPGLPVASLKFIEWSLENEISDLSKIDIGIMPLPDDEWSKGKCGFKLLQYMALGIPAVASPVGANNEIISEGVEGLFCNSKQQWIDALEKLMNDPALRERMGSAGRMKVEKYYSVNSNSSTFLSLFSL